MIYVIGIDSVRDIVYSVDNIDKARELHSHMLSSGLFDDVEIVVTVDNKKDI